jgi:hypothetical protein
MGRLSLVLLLIVAGCAGTQVPQHNGYKGKKPQPWKKAKALKFDDKMEAKAEGDLSYPGMKRAAWFVADLQQGGELDVRVEITPPGDGVNDEFDLGVEVMDSGFRTIAKSDLEDGEAGELTKTKSLLDLEPGKYYVHLYLQGRLDTADYVLRATFKPMSTVGKSDFPAQVAFVPTLPMVPLSDDTPKTYKATTTATTAVVKRTPPKGTPPKKDEPKAPTTELSAKIMSVSVVGGATQITISRGTSGNAAVGMKGKIVGVSNGEFALAACTERTCTATLKVTPDQIKGSTSVVLTP